MAIREIREILKGGLDHDGKISDAESLAKRNKAA
jgi:hypothetical protein